MPLRVAIVGTGTAGLAAGIFLARAGHEVTLFERAPAEEAVGAGFLLQPTGLSVLRELGVEKDVLAITEKIDGLYCRTRSGRVLLDLSYADLDDGLFGLGTHRSSLLRVLLSKLANEGVEVQWGREIKSMSLKGQARFLEDGAGKKEGPFDLVLICDGARSSLLDQAGIKCRVDRYPWGALWFVGRRTEEFERDQLWQCVGSTRELCGFLPTGTDDDLLSLFWSVRMADEIPDLSNWKKQVLCLVPQAESFLNQIESVQQLQHAGYHDVRMKQWHGERVALLGDAAHALSPQLGQGVNLALVDAAVLCQCLERHPLQMALVEFSKLRKAHLRLYQWATRWTTPFFQSDLVPLGVARDLAFPVAMKIPWVRRQMTASMAGLKTGLFGSRFRW